MSFSILWMMLGTLQSANSWSHDRRFAQFLSNLAVHRTNKKEARSFVISDQILTYFQTSFTHKFRHKFATAVQFAKSQKIPSHDKHVTTLPCKIQSAS